MIRMSALGWLAWLAVLSVNVASMAAGENGAEAEAAGYQTVEDYQVG